MRLDTGVPPRLAGSKVHACTASTAAASKSAPAECSTTMLVTFASGVTVTNRITVG
jgi:hypothetical protein